MHENKLWMQTYMYIEYVDSRRAVISGERNVHKELIAMPLEGFWCENNDWPYLYDIGC